MLIYDNVPTWSRRELRYVAAALATAKATTRSVERLREAIEEQLTGWTAVPVGSGRYALRLAIETLGLTGRRIAVPAYVCPAVIVAIDAAGASSVPIDCALDSIRFDPDALRDAARANRIDGVIAANTYGLDQDHEFLRSLGLPIIDDAAYQCGLDSNSQQRNAGVRGDAGVWSFNFKALSGIGGGVLLLPREKRFRRFEAARHASLKELARVANYGLRSLVRHRVPRMLPAARFRAPDTADAIRPAWRTAEAYVMSALQAAIALAQWERRAELIGRQQRNATTLLDALVTSDSFVPLSANDAASGVRCLPVLVKARGSDASSAVEYARRALYTAGIHTETAYPVVAGSAADLPRATDLSSRMFLLPCHAGLGPKQLRHVRAAISETSAALAERFVVSIASSPTPAGVR